MPAGYNDSADSQYSMMSTDMSTGIYDGGTSSESSASSPLNVSIERPLRSATPLTSPQGYENLYAGNQFMPYPAFPMQYPTSGDYPTPMGLIPVELDIEGLYEDHDRRRRKNGNEKVVASHVHSVCSPTSHKQNKQADDFSAAEPKIEPHSEPSETGKRSICGSLSNNLANSRVDIATSLDPTRPSNLNTQA